MASPVGLIISSGKHQWKVGKEVGSGACASVHLLQEVHNGNGAKSKSNNTSTSSWVVKIAPLPTKITKQRKTPPERNAHLIYYEELMYQSQFVEFQGDILPRLPAGGHQPPSKGQGDGYTYLIMERMQAPLWDVVPALLQQQQKKIDVSPVAQQLLSCVQKLHTRKHLLIDVKPENFMLACDAGVSPDSSNTTKTKKRPAVSNRKSSTSMIADELASKIRLLDLGLVAPYKINGGHRSDDGITEIIGTPLYSSLKVHDLHTPSRRDDLESIGYVLAELIIRLVAASNGSTVLYEGKNKNDIPSYLPWSQESSDDAIGKVKAAEVTNLNSNFYKRMGDKETAETMKDFFDMTNAMKYKEEPDYDAFRTLLSNLIVSVSGGASKKNKAAATKKQTAKKSTKPSATMHAATKRMTRSQRAAARIPSDDESEIDDESPQKQRKVIDVESDDETFMDAEMMDVDSESESVFHDAEEMAMDWEPSKENTVKPKARLGLALLITSGPHSGESYELLKGETACLVIGKNPKSSKPRQQEFLWPLPHDSEVGDTHVKLDLRASKQSSSIKITDLKCGATLVDQKVLKKGANVQAFIGNSFVIGESTFMVKELSKKATLAHNYQSAARIAKKSPIKKQTSSRTKPTAVLAVVSGPHKGETFHFVKDAVEVLNVGSATSTAKKGTAVVLASDGNIEKRHAVLTLVASKKVVKVAVKDLSESGAWVNGKQTVKGKEHMTFVNDLIKIGDTEFMVKLD